MQSLCDAFTQVRDMTERLCAPLSAEDCNIQSAPFVSPPKWHLAHTTWFFEHYVLRDSSPRYEVFHPAFGDLFRAEGEPMAPRGVLSRPSLDEVLAYRAHVDDAMTDLLEAAEMPGATPLAEALAWRVQVGLEHEREHQERLLVDVKHNLGANPLRPAYFDGAPALSRRAEPLAWHAFSAGRAEVGHAGNGFALDDEGPRHAVRLKAFRLASRTVTNGEYAEFVAAGGYEDPRLWLADGWAACRAHGWRAPLYWESRDGDWWHYTLSGMRPLASHEPVCHVSYFEADAFARWSGKRLPTEAEWEHAAHGRPARGNFAESEKLQPAAAPRSQEPVALFGDVWEWTASAYAPYPGYRAWEGPLAGYSAAFRDDQRVLRGGSCVTPGAQARATYRHAAQPDDRSGFHGIRLADDEA